jgi:Predicted phosphohydrolases
MTAVLAAIVSFYVLVNCGIIWWFWRALRGAGFVRILVCSLLLLLAVAFPALFRNSDDSVLQIALLRTGAFWLGTYFYVFLTILVIGILRRLFTQNRQKDSPRYLACFIALALPLCISIGGWFNASVPVVHEYDITVEAPAPAGLPDGKDSLTVAAISDMHLGRTITNVRLNRAIDLIAPYNPDLVLFLGDVIDDHILIDTDGMKAAITRLKPQLGTWGILGNHEYISGDIGVSLDLLEKGGIRVLRDGWAAPENMLLLAGRDDYEKQRFDGESRKSLPEILKAVPEEQRALPLLVLDHQPRHLEEAENAGAVLQLSGHTHYGQLWPFNLIVDAFYENARGLSARNDTRYIVSVGAGTWGPPLRNTARPEVLLINLKFRSANM